MVSIDLNLNFDKNLIVEYKIKLKIFQDSFCEIKIVIASKRRSILPKYSSHIKSTKYYNFDIDFEFVHIANGGSMKISNIRSLYV